LIAGAIGLGLIPFFRSFWMLLLFSLLLGVSMATVTASTAALVADLARGAYGSALGVMSTIMDVGHASGPPVVGYLIELYGHQDKMRGYRLAYSIVGGLLLLAVAIFTVLTLCNVLSPDGEGAALYWLAALVLIVGLGAWLMLVLWCYVDAERRGMNGPLWALLVFLLGFPVGPLVYLVLQKSAGDRPAPGP